MFKATLLALVLISLCVPSIAEAKGGSRSSGKSSSKSYKSTPGTGSKSNSSSVRGYTKKNGTYVAPYKKSTPDKNARNNFSTRGNTNPYTGKRGTQDVKPGK